MIRALLPTGMVCIYSTFILSFELMLMAFLFIFQIIPGKKYIRKKANIQFFTFLFSFILIVISVFEASREQANISEINSLFSNDFLMIFLVWYGICLIASVYKVFCNRKQNEASYIELELAKDEYRIVKKLDFVLAPLLYMPHVKAYAISKNKIFIFSNSVPEENQKILLYCNALGGEAYDCFAYRIKEKKNGINYILNGMFNSLLVIAIGYFPFLLVNLDRFMISEGNVDQLQTVFTADIMVCVGCVMRNLFNHNNSTVGKLFFVLSHVIVILGIGYLFHLV